MDEYFLEPPSYDRTLRQCSRIKLQNPEIKLFPIGKSFLGRKIYALAIGNTKNAVLFAGAFHAQEWLTCSLLMRFFQELAGAYTQNRLLLEVDIRNTLREKGLICIPMVNPDGVEIAINGTKSARPHAAVCGNDHEAKR